MKSLRKGDSGRTRRPKLGGLTLSTALVVASGGAALEADELDPSRVGWSSLSYKAKKLTFSMSSDVGVEVVPASTTSGALRDPLEGSAVEPAGNEVVVVTLGVEGGGTRSSTNLWMDPRNGDAYQRQQISYGKKKNRNKTLRFTDSGVQIFFGRAAEGESPDKPEDWTGYVDRFDDYPNWAGDDLSVTEPTGIFYLVGASPLYEAGDRMQHPVWSSDNLILMEMTVVGREQIKVNYTRDGKQMKGSVPAIKILIDAQHLDPDSTEEHLEIMGMKGDVEIYLDPETRAPLQVSGRVPVAGNMNVKIKDLVSR